MKNSWLRSNKSKFSFKSKILLLLGALVLAVMVGLGAAPHAASDKTDNKPNEMLSSQTSIFDPFALSTFTPIMEGSSSTGVLTDPERRPPIHIPLRPTTRGSFRPPLVLP